MAETKDIIITVNDVLAGIGGIVMAGMGRDSKPIDQTSKAVNKLIDVAMPGEKPLQPSESKTGTLNSADAQNSPAGGASASSAIRTASADSDVARKLLRAAGWAD